MKCWLAASPHIACACCCSHPDQQSDPVEDRAGAPRTDLVSSARSEAGRHIIEAGFVGAVESGVVATDGLHIVDAG
ncbi:hypothetical protein KRP22_011060 [Phytophthora ramorum]|nr:hypothetical protein KRP22_5068 [Phytophthora ramorum]